MLTRRRLAAVAAVATAAGFAPTLVFANGDEEAIKANIEAFRKANFAKDKAVLEGLLSDKLVYGHSDGRLENKAEFIAGVMARKGTLKELKFSDVKVKAAGTNATARHIWESETEQDGKTTQIKIEVTQVWQKQADGKWQLASRLSFRPS